MDLSVSGLESIGLERLSELNKLAGRMRTAASAAAANGWGRNAILHARSWVNAADGLDALTRLAFATQSNRMLFDALGRTDASGVELQ